MVDCHFILFLVVLTVLKMAKKSKNDLINAEEGEDHFTDISSVGEYYIYHTLPVPLLILFNKCPNCPSYKHKLSKLKIAWLTECSFIKDLQCMHLLELEYLTFTYHAHRPASSSLIFSEHKPIIKVKTAL